MTTPTWPSLDESFLDASAATYNFRLGVPQPLAITPDGSVLFRRTPARERRADLYVLAPDGQVQLLASAEKLVSGASEQLSAEELARRERMRAATSGIVDIDVDEAGQRVLIPLGERVFLLDRASGKSEELKVGAGYPLDPRLSPDGKRVSFVRDGDLWTIEPGQAAPRRVTHHPAGIEYATAEFASQEEFGRQRGYWWSPDSQWIVFQRTDNAPVETVYVADARHPEKKPTEFKYPRAGKNNAVVDLGIVAAQGGEPRWLRWDLARWPYLARVVWPKRGPLSLIVLNRAQTEAVLLAVDAASGNTRSLLEVHDDAWVELPRGNPSWLDDGSGFLWITETADGNVLEHHAASGELVKRLTIPAFGMRAIAGIEPDGKSAIVLASGDPREQTVWRVPFASGPTDALTKDGGFHSAITKHGVLTISSQLREGGTRTLTLGKDGSSHELPSVAERPSLVPTTLLDPVELAGVKVYTAITRPRSFKPGQRYPVLVNVYGGPGKNMVQDPRDTYLLDQWYAEAGFIVVRVDGRGTQFRNRAWRRAISGDLITQPLQDQVDALQALAAQHPELDLARVGIFGWSFGGYVASMAVLLRPDVFKAAVAGAPVTDWELYDTAYTERYMRTPQENPDGYKKTSALTHAATLQRPLLLIHGITDDNVHFAHTLALIEALYRAGKRAEVVALSGTHMVADPKLAFAREKIQIDFFREHL